MSSSRKWINFDFQLLFMAQLHCTWIQGCFVLLTSLSVNHSLKIKGFSKEVMLVNSESFSDYKRVEGETEKSGKRNWSYRVSLLSETWNYTNQAKFVIFVGIIRIREERKVDLFFSVTLGLIKESVMWQRVQRSVSITLFYVLEKVTILLFVKFRLLG